MSSACYIGIDQTPASSPVASWVRTLVGRALLPLAAGIVTLCIGPRLASAQEPVTAFVNVTVIPMDRERILPAQTVVVRGNRIVALGPVAEVPVPPEAKTIDGQGKFLLPGLADIHAHISASDEAGLFIALANGIMTIRDMGPGEDLQWLRAARARGTVMPPRIYGVGRIQECQQDSSAYVDCFAGMKAAGYDMLKLYGDGTDNLARLDSIVAAARRTGFRIGGHAIPGAGVERALQVPYKSIEHLQGYPSAVLGYPIWPEDAEGGISREPPDTSAWLRPGYRLDPARLRDIAVKTQRAGVWNAPTLVAIEGIRPALPLPGQQEAISRYLDLLLQIVKALHDAGAGLLLSEDRMGQPNQAGFAIHDELALLIRAGLTPYEALVTGTRNAAVYLGTEDSAGTVAVGKWADLILLDGNPLQNIHYTARPAGVMADGQWFSRADIDARLDALEAKGCFLADVRREAAQYQEISHASLAAMQEQSTGECHD